MVKRGCWVLAWYRFELTLDKVADAYQGQLPQRVYSSPGENEGYKAFLPSDGTTRRRYHL